MKAKTCFTVIAFLALTLMASQAVALSTGGNEVDRDLGIVRILESQDDGMFDEDTGDTDVYGEGKDEWLLVSYGEDKRDTDVFREDDDELIELVLENGGIFEEDSDLGDGEIIEEEGMFED